MVLVSKRLEMCLCVLPPSKLCFATNLKLHANCHITCIISRDFLYYIYIFFYLVVPSGEDHILFALCSDLLSVLSVWWCYLAKRQNETQTFISCLTLPAMVCPTARTVIIAPPDSAQLSQNYLSCILVSHKRKTESLQPDPAFCRQRHRNTGRRESCLQPARCLLCRVSLLNRNK